MDKQVKARIMETGEIKILPAPVAHRWKSRIGKIKWNDMLQCYDMSQEQYDFEMRMSKYRKAVGYICAIVFAMLIIMAFKNR